MSEGVLDPFAPLPHEELLRARTTSLPLPQLSGAIIRAAENVMTMGEDDPRRRYAQQYLAHMLAALDRPEEVAELERVVSGRTSPPNVVVFGPYIAASTLMRNMYGGTDPLSAVDVELGMRDAEIARLATEGMAAADAVLTREVLGFAGAA